MKRMIGFKQFMSLVIVVFLIIVGTLVCNQRTVKAVQEHVDPELKLATHNVYMMSTLLYPNWGQGVRANLIPEAKYLKADNIHEMRILPAFYGISIFYSVYRNGHFCNGKQYLMRRMVYQ